MLAEIARLEGEKQQAARTIAALAAERDGCRADLQTTRAALAAAEGALGEARKQVEHENGRNATLSERVIAEAARALALGAQFDELQTKGK
jgi:chromosome segregation ATPase